MGVFLTLYIHVVICSLASVHAILGTVMIWTYWHIVKKILFVCDGNYTPFLDDIAACGNSGFWFEYFTDLEAVVEKFGQTHFIIGNGDARVLTFGRKAQIRSEVERCMNRGRGCPGYFMCISGHIPPNVPVENALYYNDLYLSLRQR